MAPAAEAAELLARVEDLIGCQKFVSQKEVDVEHVGKVSLERRDWEGSPLGVYRTKGTIRGTLNSVCGALWSTGIPTRDRSRIIEWRVVEDIDEDSRVVLEVQDMPWPLDRREFVYLQLKRMSAGKFFYCGSSVEHPNCPVPEEGSKVIRGSIWAGMCVEEAGEGKLNIVNTGRVDPYGELPPAVVEFFTDRMALYIGKIQETIQGRGRRFRVVTEKGIGMRNSPDAQDRVSKHDAKEYGSVIPGGYGLPQGEEIEAEEMEGEWPHDHVPGWVKFHVKKMIGDNRSFWVPVHSADGRRLLEPIVVEQKSAS
eukprot:TRINITY_DN60611_c0_g1_i1.p2 TRINITY_DN60611_c0_g1~~TRINITY_DN60611_c0_g1_i1.p2  ORF type:complete len:311 (+),score=75.87 TRINITY_DN60611_c0_g1_i1:84-1016(+)